MRIRRRCCNNSDITVVPLTIQWGDEAVATGVSTPEILQRMSEGEAAPNVLGPSFDDFLRVYRSMRDTCDGVISIHVSAR